MIGSAVSYLHEDHIGSIRFVSSSTGSQVFSSNYIPYGPQYGASGTPDEFLYAGKIYDGSTGFYYFGARYYDPTIGRFVTQDSSSGVQEDPQSLNRYVYARDNPLKIIDPNGHDWNLFGALTSALSSAAGAFSNAANTLANALSSISPLAQSVVSRIGSTVSSTSTSLTDAGQRVAQRMAQGAQTAASQVSQVVSGAAACFSKVCGAVAVTAGLAAATVAIALFTYKANPVMHHG